MHDLRIRQAAREKAFTMIAIRRVLRTVHVIVVLCLTLLLPGQLSISGEASFKAEYREARRDGRIFGDEFEMSGHRKRIAVNGKFLDCDVSYFEAQGKRKFSNRCNSIEQGVVESFAIMNGERLVFFSVFDGEHFSSNTVQGAKEVNQAFFEVYPVFGPYCVAGMDILDFISLPGFRVASDTVSESNDRSVRKVAWSIPADPSVPKKRNGVFYFDIGNKWALLRCEFEVEGSYTSTMTLDYADLENHRVPKHLFYQTVFKNGEKSSEEFSNIEFRFEIPDKTILDLAKYEYGAPTASFRLTFYLIAICFLFCVVVFLRWKLHTKSR